MLTFSYNQGIINVQNKKRGKQKMMMFVVLDNTVGEAPRVFSTLEKAKLFCETQKKHYLDLVPEDECLYDDNVEVTEEGFSDVFIIKPAEVDDYSDYDW